MIISRLKLYSGRFSSVLFALLILTIPAQAVEIKQVRSPAGVTAWLVEDYTVPIVAIRFAFEGGSVQDPENMEGLANLMTGLFDEGAGDLEAEEFQERLDVAAAEMSFSAGRDSISGSMRMLAEKRDEAFELLALAVNKPRFDESAVTRIRAQIVSSIRAKLKDPEEIAAKRWREALYGDHPYARPQEGTPESLSRIDNEDLQRFHGRVFARSNLHVGVVGAIDPETLGRMLDDVFGNLPAQAELVPVDDAVPALDQQMAIELPQPQTSLRLAYPGVPRDHEGFFAAYLMNHILGGGSFSSRLYDEIREKRGLAYGVGSYLSNNDYSDLLVIGTSTRSDRASETLGIILDEVSRMAKDGPTPAELADAKKYVLGAYAINNLDTSSAIANTLVGLQQENLGIDYIERRERLINAVTIDEVREIADRLLRPAPAILIVGQDAESVVGRNGKIDENKGTEEPFKG